ncbi:hypothetical protein BDV12DRAFT_199332 [Aspergillus spectabilis]
MERPNSARPETDYERWLQEQDENYQLGDESIYEPDTLALNGPVKTQKDEDILSHGTFLRPPQSKSSGFKDYPKTSSIVGLALLVMVILKAVKGFRKRREQAGGDVPSAKSGDKSRTSVRDSARSLF